jgi:WhiB family redox-sensing transcriptional regulator
MMSDTQDLADLIEHSPEMAWVQRAACRDFDADRLDLFFVEAGHTLSKEAATICAGCEVRVDCLSHAYDREIAAGYFGGVSSAKRRVLTFDQAVELTEK